MKFLNMTQTADYLEGATIEHTTDAGIALVHVGINENGCRFVMINDIHGKSAVTETL
jgi:hypothetical protein